MWRERPQENEGGWWTVRPTVVVGGARAAGETLAGKSMRDELGELGEVRRLAQVNTLI